MRSARNALPAARILPSSSHHPQPKYPTPTFKSSIDCADLYLAPIDQPSIPSCRISTQSACPSKSPTDELPGEDHLQDGVLDTEELKVRKSFQQFRENGLW
ncbi:hypothetical protein RchiOBHm_Chr5g0017251 [Rosa chinensis]|uniref:Uncharacterized protein n=1 Tax=Rosa chinensis TaxID=74649 RepID=A0A2P6Q6F5_ROSCH|nr:hypothetical protein RchiOBHm_Chr5g0017251 [Rosa chinensis]